MLKTLKKLQCEEVILNTELWYLLSKLLLGLLFMDESTIYPYAGDIGYLEPLTPFILLAVFLEQRTTIDI